MSDRKSLYFIQGKLKVAARGFWYTMGGEKGSFGYYPHLKDADGYPVYPDTQLLGDLRMAAQWLVEREPREDGRQMVERVFGREGDANQGMLRLTDLEMSLEARLGTDRKEKRLRDILAVKPRTMIEDETRTVTDHMLVNLELAWLDGCELRSTAYLGYCKSEEELDKAKELLIGAAELVSGFGAFRSRGYGRGTVSFEFPQANIRVEGVPAKDPPPATSLYFLTSLVNMRNVRIEPARTQVLESIDRITTGQLRGWFCRTYEALFGSWPTPREMSTIVLPDLYPCEGDELAYPAPMTTLCNEHKEVEDFWDKHTDAVDDAEGENFFRTKSKPLGPHRFVTDAASIRIVPLTVEARFRNKLGTSFIPDDDSLIVQEMIGKNTRFGGAIRFHAPDSDFSRKAWTVLSQRPTIKGAVFEPEMRPDGTGGNSATGASPLLVTSPLLFSPDRIQGKNCITLDTLRRYSTTLARPRRNRLVIAPGSVICGGPERSGTVPWQGFRRRLGNLPVGKHRLLLMAPSTDAPAYAPADFPIGVDKEKLTRAQMGHLRELANTLHREDFLKLLLVERIEKYRGRKSETDHDLLKLFESILKEIDSHGLKAMRDYVSFIHEELQLYWWERNKRNRKDGASHD